jgi:hypothetical protein
MDIHRDGFTGQPSISETDVNIAQVEKLTLEN